MIVDVALKCCHPTQSTTPPVVPAQPLLRAPINTTTIIITATTTTTESTVSTENTGNIENTARTTPAANHITTTAMPTAQPSTTTTSTPYPRQAVATATATATSTNQISVPRSLAETTSLRRLNQTARPVLTVTSPAARMGHRAIDLIRWHNNRTKSIITTHQHAAGPRTVNWPLRGLLSTIQCGVHCVVVDRTHQKLDSQLITVFASHPCQIRQSVLIW